MTKKPLPFKLDRASSDSFRRQLVEGVREAIRAGYYKAGDVLPSLGEAVAALKVSDIVVRGAYRTLAAEGLIVSRKGYGSVVHPPKTPIWRGRVLCVSTDFDFSLLQCATVERLRAHCLRNGYQFAQATTLTDRRGKVDFHELDRALKRPVDFILLTQSVSEVVQCLSQTGIPFAVVGGGTDDLPHGCVGRIPMSSEKAVGQFVVKCHRRGVRHVEIVCCKRISAFAERVMNLLEGRGIATTIGWVPDVWGVGRVEVAERSGFDFVRRNARKRKAVWPDLYYVCDDHVARGMLMAFATFGVRVPEDVRFVCSAMTGFRPVFPKSVAAIVSDPYPDGDEVARRVLAWLTKRRPFPAPPVESVFAEGETFP